MSTSTPVVGAGLLGLLYALRTKAPCIYERENRAGGHIFTEQQGTTIYDLGYGWFYETESTMMDIAPQYGEIVDFPCQSYERMAKDFVDELNEFSSHTEHYDTFASFARSKIGDSGYKCIKNRTTLSMEENPKDILKALTHRVSRRKTVKGGMQKIIDGMLQECEGLGIPIYCNTEAGEEDGKMIVSHSSRLCTIVVRFKGEPFAGYGESIPRTEGFDRITPIDANTCILYSTKPWITIEIEEDLKHIVRGVCMESYPSEEFVLDDMFTPHICCWREQNGTYPEMYTFEQSLNMLWNK